MFETLLIGTSGLLGHAKGLRVVGNNLANVNTPGFKSAQMQFGSLFEENATSHEKAVAQSATNTLGTGMETLGSKINFKSGLDQNTGNPLDVNINGNGFFTVAREGKLVYTRAGDFRFDDKHVLVNTNGDHVQALKGGKVTDLTLDGLLVSPAKASTTVKFVNSISITDPTVVSGISVNDAMGKVYAMNMTITPSGASGNFLVTVTNAADGTTLLSNAALAVPAAVNATSNFLNVNFPAIGTIKFDFFNGVTSGPTGLTALAVASQDGYSAGLMTDQTIGEDGVISVKYSNGQTVKGPRLALANFNTDQDLEQLAGSSFAKKENAAVQYGYAADGNFGKLAAGHREGANVDLAEEFSNLILMQRGYQASSHVISTANDMIQELFDMKGRR